MTEARIEVTEGALTEIRSALEGKGEHPTLRLYIAGMSCRGPSWGMALDEPSEDDERVDMGDFSIVAEKALLEQVGGVQVDYVDSGWQSGFSIRGQNDEEPGAGHCGSCGC